jgi:glycolate oxidase FAD binding subunit
MELNSVIIQQFQSLLEPGAVVAWEDLPAFDQQRIRAAIAPQSPLPACVVSPPHGLALQEVVRCCARNQWPLLIQGQGTKLHWGAGVKGAAVVISTQHLTQWVDHAAGDLTLTAESGLPLATAQERLHSQGQFIALDPLYGGSLGGLVMTASAGSLRHRYGGVRDMVLGVEFVRSDGEKVKAGGRVVKNVAGYDLMKLLTGSHGSLGLITQVTLRLYPLPETWGTIVLTGSLASLQEATQTLRRSALTPVAFDLISAPVVEQLGLGDQDPAKSPLHGLILRFGTLQATVTEQMAAVQSLGDRLGMITHRFPAETESQFWQTLRQLFQAPSSSPQSLLLKLAVSPTHTVEILGQTPTLCPALQPWLWFHGGSGLGYGRFTLDSGNPPATLEEQITPLQTLRTLCQQHQGFMTLLAAPPTLKQALEVWGYQGNALPLMTHLKQQFDPCGILNPQQFVGSAP